MEDFHIEPEIYEKVIELEESDPFAYDFLEKRQWKIDDIQEELFLDE